MRRVSWDEAWRMYKAGEITDSLSVIAILHEAVRRLEDGYRVSDASPPPCGLVSP